MTTAPPASARSSVTPAAVLADRQTAFSAPFNDESQWGTNTTAYPQDTSNGWHGDHKYDRISGQSRIWGTTFSADRNGSAWDTDLATTENTAGGFKVRTGDSVQARVTVFDPRGAWPAIWTWNPNQPGKGEVDLFEYHSTNPNLLEFWNKVGGGQNFADHVVQPGVPFTLQVDLNADGIVWSVNGNQIYRGMGLPADWDAYLIANLSVADGSMPPHSAPADSQNSMVGMSIDYLTVSR